MVEDNTSSEQPSSSSVKMRKKTPGTSPHQSDSQGSKDSPHSNSQSKEDIFATMIASALKEVEMEQVYAEEQKRHPTIHERCKKTIIFPEVVVADRQKGILGFKMHKYVLEQDRIARQPKTKSGSAKTEPQPRSTCKYVRKAESSLESTNSSESILGAIGAANAQNADPQPMTSSAPNKQDAQQDDERGEMLSKKPPHKRPPES